MSVAHLTTSIESAPGYRIGDLLGSGGSALVYEAEHDDIPSPCALKIVLARDAGNRLSRLEREARVLGDLRHPHIIGIHAWSVSHSVGWIAMELADSTVHDSLRLRGAMQTAEAVRVALDVSSALEAAHDAGVIHRDVKPSNLLWVGETVRLADFGIARVDASELTAVGSQLGSATFMAPEQAFAPSNVDASCDVYGLAASTFAMVTRRSPRDLHRIGLDHERWSAVRHEGLRDLLRDALTTLPTDRPSLTEMQRRLRNLNTT